MKFYLGKTKLPGTHTFVSDGYWFKGAGDKEYTFFTYDKPRDLTRDVISMWGVSIGATFVGVMRVSKSRMEKRP